MVMRNTTMKLAFMTLAVAMTAVTPAPAAMFTFGTFAWDENNTPDVKAYLPSGIYSGAIVTSQPATATGSVAFPDSSMDPFNTTIALGNLANTSGGPRALNLPNGNNGVASRSGVVLGWSGGRTLADQAGNDFVVYESGNIGDPELFMVQIGSAASNIFSSWR